MEFNSFIDLMNQAKLAGELKIVWVDKSGKDKLPDL
jgi:hypothetical protein